MFRTRAFGMTMLLVIAATLTACGDTGQEHSLYTENILTPEEANYDTVQVKEGDYIKTNGGAVRIYYPITAELCWEEGDARFRELLVKKGQEVKKGDSLASFEVGVSRAEREELSLTLTRTLENTETGKQERLAAMEEETEKLKELGGYELRIAKLRIEKLQVAYEQFVYQSEQEIQRLQERLAELDEKIANDTLSAPFDGVIDTVISCNEGDLITRDMVIVTMHATDRFYLVADDSFGKLRYNVDVTVEAGGRNDRKKYPGKVVAAPSILPLTVPQGLALIELYGDVSPDDLKGSPQYEFHSEELENVLMVDWRAIDSENGKNYVYVLENDMVQKRYVVPGLSNRESTWILDGLEEGQTVIAD